MILKETLHVGAGVLESTTSILEMFDDLNLNLLQTPDQNTTVLLRKAITDTEINPGFSE